MRDCIYHKRLKISIRRTAMIGAFFLFLLPTILLAKMANDPFIDQWSYRDTKVFDAWDMVTGSDRVIVAIVDNGFDMFHPDLEPNVWKNLREIPDNGIDDDRNGYVDDVWGWNFVENDNNPRPNVFHLTQEDIEDGAIHHGTVVAGIIGAVGNNGQFGSGINWRVQLMNLKVVGNSGAIDSPRIPEAIRYAVDNGADIINISLIGPEDPEMKESIKYAYDHGVAVIAAAGNDYFSLDDYPRYPICADAFEGEQWVLGVSAINEAHRLARFSNTGSCIDITAPGVNVSGTERYAPGYGLPDYYGGPHTGTSFAAPFVSGAAALVKSIHPEWGAKDIFDTLLQTVHKTPPQNEAEYARNFGKGLVQIGPAVIKALSYIRSTRVLSDIEVISPDSGTLFRESDRRLEVVPDRVRTMLRSASAIVSYSDTRGVGFIAVESKKNQPTRITVFDPEWRERFAWTTTMTGNLAAVAAPLLEGGETALVLAPRTADTIAFRAYDLTGRELAMVSAPSRHTGVVLGEVLTSDGVKLLAVYTENGVPVIHRFNRSWTIDARVVIPDLSSVGAVGGGDIDGNGTTEYVVGAGAGTDPYILYYTAEGVLLRKFFAYSPGNTQGLQLAVGDYDDDGADDIVVASEKDGLPLRVWTHRSRRIAEWWPFGQTYRGRLSLLPFYE